MTWLHKREREREREKKEERKKERNLFKLQEMSCHKNNVYYKLIVYRSKKKSVVDPEFLAYRKMTVKTLSLSHQRNSVARRL